MVQKYNKTVNVIAHIYFIMELIAKYKLLAIFKTKFAKMAASSMEQN